MTDQFQNEPTLKSVDQAFAPLRDTLKNIQAKIEIPEAARDFVKRAAGTAKDRAADLHAGADKMTAAIETAVAGSVTETAKISRNIQQALYQDAEAFFHAIDKLASAKSLGEAFEIQTDLIRARTELAIERSKATGAYVSKLLANGAQATQDNLSKVASFTTKAA